MPLQKKVVNVGIQAGMDQSSDRFTQDGVLVDAKNVRFTHDGAAESRKGHSQVGSTFQLGLKSRLLSDSSKLSLIHKGRQYSVSQSGITGGNFLAPCGTFEQVASCAMYGPRIIKRDICAAETGSSFLVVWTIDHGGTIGYQTYAKLFDANWNEVPCATTSGVFLPSGARGVRLAAIGDVYFAAYSFGQSIYYVKFDCTSLAAPSMSASSMLVNNDLTPGTYEFAFQRVKKWSGVAVNYILLSYLTVTTQKDAKLRLLAYSGGVLVDNALTSVPVAGAATVMFDQSIASESTGAYHYMGVACAAGSYLLRYNVSTNAFDLTVPLNVTPGKRISALVCPTGDIAVAVTTSVGNGAGADGITHTTHFQKYSSSFVTIIGPNVRVSPWAKLSSGIFSDPDSGDTVIPVLIGGSLLYRAYGSSMPDVSVGFLVGDAMTDNTVICAMPCIGVLSPGYAYMEEDRIGGAPSSISIGAPSSTVISGGKIYTAHSEFYSGIASPNYSVYSLSNSASETEISAARTVVVAYSNSTAGALNSSSANGYYAGGRVCGIALNGPTCPATSPGFCYATYSFSLNAPMENGTYYYYVCYATLTSDGAVCRSAPSNIVATTLAPAVTPVAVSGNPATTPTSTQRSNDSFFVTVPMPPESNVPLDFQGGPSLTSCGTMIELYRSNKYSITGSERLVAQSLIVNTLGSLATAPTIQFGRDNTADEDLAPRRALYTGGGSLPNTCPPALVALAGYRGRLYGIDYTRRRIWFSKQIVDGESPAFCSDFTMELPWPGYALAVMDDKLVVFGDGHIGAIAGWGPSDSGANNDLGDVQNVASDVGCVNPESIVLTPSGLLFMSQVGFYQLNRSLNLSFVGKPIQDTVAAYPTIDCAVVHPTEQVAMWGCTGPSGSIRLVYNYLLNRWSYDVIGQIVQANADRRVLSMAAHKGLLYSLLQEIAPGGFRSTTVIVETPTSYLDNGFFIPTAVEVSSTKLAGVMGFQRAWKAGIIGERFTDHDLTIKVSTDDELTPTQSHTFDSASVSAFPLRESMLVRIVRQLCRSVRVRVETSTPTGIGATMGNGRGMALSGVMLELGVHEGAVRLPAGQKG
jgi:hypothetical protein